MYALDDSVKMLGVRPPGRGGELIAFLLSPRAGSLTGALINVDGGTNF